MKSKLSILERAEIKNLLLKTTTLDEFVYLINRVIDIENRYLKRRQQLKINSEFLKQVLSRKLYFSFKLKKKNRKYRTILSPEGGLKFIQQKLKVCLECLYDSNPIVHGYVYSKNIMSNAALHVGKEKVLNVDLKEFFPSISYGRIFTVLTSTKYYLHKDVANIISNIACYKNKLPIGAPCSPVISNLVCEKLDRRLFNYCKKMSLSYCGFIESTRYADDLSFSGNLSSIMIKSIKGIIENEGFKINFDKERLQPKMTKQEVTGLVVNTRVNVKRKLIKEVRVMLHNWQSKGLTAAEYEFCKVPRLNKKGKPSKFVQVLNGWIGFIGSVRGKTDPIYLTYHEKFESLERNRKTNKIF